MTPMIKKHGSIIISLVGAVGIVVTAWWSKGTQYNDTAWLYAFCVWLFFFSAFEAYTSMSKGNKDT